MKIVVAGEWSDNAMEIPIVTAWRKLGHDVVVVVWPMKSRSLNLGSRIQTRLGSVHTLSGKLYNSQLKKVLQNENPDVFFVFKGMNVWEDTVSWAVSRGIYSVNFNPDHPFIFSGRGSGNDIVRKSIKLYNCHLTYSRTIRDYLRSYGVESELIPFGYDLPAGWSTLKESVQEEISGAFIGNADDDRLYWMSQFFLSYKNNKFVFYGHGWERLQKDMKNVELRSPVYGTDFWAAMRRHRFQLNVMRVHNLDSHNMRSVESLAAGAIGLHPSTNDHQEWIEHGKNGFLFHSFADAGMTGSKLLRLDQKFVRDLRKQAESRSISLKASYAERSQQILDFISEKISK